jgi:hypothetical protein
MKRLLGQGNCYTAEARRGAEVARESHWRRFTILTIQSLTDDSENVARLCVSAFLCVSAVSRSIPPRCV